MGFNPPATAGPLNTSFNVPAPAPDARRPPGTQFRTAHTAAPAEDQVPMTAALGGKFGTRLSSINTGRLSDDEDGERTPMTPTRVISGGPSLGAMAANGTGATPASPTTGPSKADGASTWRRGPVGASPLGAMRSVSPSVRITPPPSERVSPPPASAVGPRARPSPLQFNLAAAAPMLPAVSVAEAGEAEVEDEFSSSQSAGSSPVASDASSGTSLSPREEAAKRLYEGLGVGRPAPAVVAPVPVHPRVVSQAVHARRLSASRADRRRAWTSSRRRTSRAASGARRSAGSTRSSTRASVARSRRTERPASQPASKSDAPELRLVMPKSRPTSCLFNPAEKPENPTTPAFFRRASRPDAGPAHQPARDAGPAVAGTGLSGRPRYAARALAPASLLYTSRIPLVRSFLYF
jgi:hypothetical protein